MKTTTAGNLTTVCDNGGQVVLATSYDTCLLASKGGIVVLNVTKYSHTTTCHQGVVEGMLASYKAYSILNILRVDDCPRGADCGDLLTLAGL